jgi:16S rRNA (adenine1518-N6/adenine1519-N6)-dimethyltransferase
MRTHLGQNFLVNEQVAQKIARLANIQDANVLEIGPGRGILTKYLVERAEKFLAVEIDERLAKNIESSFSRLNLELARDSISLKIITGDILKINLSKLIEENKFQPYKVVANLPYYITSKIIRLLLETKYPPEEMILMVQKEVGERIVARDGKESLLSISVKLYADPEILFSVPKENFSPAPEVDSVVIRIKRKKEIPDVIAAKFFQIVRAGFSSKRKMLSNNLSSGLHIPKNDITDKIKNAGLDPGIRAEKLSVEEWIKIFEKI